MSTLDQYKLNFPQLCGFVGWAHTIPHTPQSFSQYSIVEPMDQLLDADNKQAEQFIGSLTCTLIIMINNANIV